MISSGNISLSNFNSEKNLFPSISHCALCFNTRLKLLQQDFKVASSNNCNLWEVNKKPKVLSNPLYCSKYLIKRNNNLINKVKTIINRFAFPNFRLIL